jgi:2-hydroxychromene-2-carboxylate isomerase
LSIQLYFDFVSPYSYLAFSQRKVIAERTGITPSLHPVSVIAIMGATNNTPTSITCPAKRTYARADMARWAEKYGVTIVPHPNFGRFSTEPLLLAAISAIAAGKGDAFCEAAFHAIWRDSADVENEAAMADYFDQRVLGGRAFWQGRASAADALASNVNDAVAAGAFGVPSFVTPKGLFFGNDRLEFLVEAMTS